MCEKGTSREERTQKAMRECLDNERWRLFCCGHHHKGSPHREQSIKDYRYTDGWKTSIFFSLFNWPIAPVGCRGSLLDDPDS